MAIIEENANRPYYSVAQRAWGALGLALSLGKRRDCPVLLSAMWPHLEHWMQFGLAQYKEKKLLERVQRRATNRVSEVSGKVSSREGGVYGTG